MNSMNKSVKSNLTILVVFIAVFAVVPLFFNRNYFISVLIQCFLFAAMGVSWNLIGGYGGQVSLGHSAFVAVGAYTSFIMYIDLHVSPLVSVFAGAILAGVLALLIGSLCLGLKGTYFSLSTIAFAEIFKSILLHFRELTRGSYGLNLTFTGTDPLNLQFENKMPFYFISMGLLVLIILFNIAFERTKTGFFLRAICEDEIASRSLGLETSKIKLKVFVISAMLTSVVGTFYGFYLTYIMPTSISSVALSIKIIVCTVIGGAGILWGPVLGAFIIIMLTELVNAKLGTLGGANTLMYGAVLILIIIFKPRGLIAAFEKGSWLNKQLLKIKNNAGRRG